MDVALKAIAADNAAGDPMAADIRRQVEETDVFTEGIPPFSVARGHLVLALCNAPDCLIGTRSASGIEKPRQGLTRRRQHALGRAFFVISRRHRRLRTVACRTKRARALH